MDKALYCNACGAQLTNPLTMCSGGDPSIVPPEFADGLPLSATGTAYESYEPIVRASGNTPAALEFVPQFWLNPDDLTDVVQLTKNRRRLTGCCGLDGLNGPNQLCRCGTVVGTLQSDCWTPLVFIPELGATSWASFPEGLGVVIP